MPPPLRQPPVALLAPFLLTACAGVSQRIWWAMRSSLSVDRGASTASGGNFKVGKCDPPLPPASSAFPSPPFSLPPLHACAGAHRNGLRDRRVHRPRDSSTGRPTLIFFGASQTPNIPPCPILSPSGPSPDPNPQPFPTPASTSPCPSLHGRHPRSRSTGTTALPLRSSYFPRAPASAGARNFRGRRHLHPLGRRRKGEPNEIDMSIGRTIRI